MAEDFEVGQRVTYTGTFVRRYVGKIGTIQLIDDRGWIFVDFGDGDPVACSDVNLEKVSK